MYTTYKFRIYPTKEQQARLNAWSNGCRFLWNLAHEQRLMGLSRPKDERVFLSNADQHRELTLIRKEHRWIKDIPRHVAESVLNRLDDAWQCCFNKNAHTPRWKRKGQWISLSETDPKSFRIASSSIKFSKMPDIRAVIHRTIVGQVKTCTLVKDGKQWYAYLHCHVDDRQAQESRLTCPSVGIDRGITSFTADSDGLLTPGPRFFAKSEKLLRRAQRKLSRKKKGSNKRKKAARRVANIHRKIRFQRADFLHKLSTNYAKNHGLVVLEDLKIKNMVQGNCSKGIADSGWGMFAQMLEYKLQWNGGQLQKVDPKGTSQTCSACKVIDSKSRVGELFSCTSCKHTEHADINAAKVILSRADRSVLPVEGSPKCRTQGSGKVKLRRLRRSNNKESILIDHTQHDDFQ